MGVDNKQETNIRSFQRVMSRKDSETSEETEWVAE